MMTRRETRAGRVLRLSREAVRKATATERRSFTITKFGRHEDGYLHARVVVDGKPIYVHRRYGSWMAPGTVKGSAVMKELESLGLKFEVKEELQTKARALEKAERKAHAASDTPDGSHAERDAVGELPAPDLRNGGDGKGADGAPGKSQAG